MGHLVNPLSFRLCNNFFWQSSWVSNLNYNYFISLDLCYFSFLSRNLKGKKKFLGSYFFMFSHFSFFRCRKKIFILCHFLNFSRLQEIVFWAYFNRFFDDKILKKRISYVNLPYSSRFVFYIKNIIKFFLTLHSYSLTNRLYSFYSFFLKKKLSYLSSFKENKNLKVVLVPLKRITAEILSIFIAQCLERRYSLNRIIFPITKFLRYRYWFNSQERHKRNLLRKYYGGHCYSIKGIKVCYGGRFIKKRRVSVTKFEIGAISSNSISEKITYGSSIAYTRFGVGGVKVWLCE